MKKYFILILFLLCSIINDIYSQINTSAEFLYNSKSKNILISAEPVGNWSYFDCFGILDDYQFCKLSSGIRMKNKETEWIYHAKLLAYKPYYRIPMIRSKHYKPNNGNFDGNVLPDNYNTFLTLSYQGLDISNDDIYKKDYKWSSLGVDLLYKDFGSKSLFYSRFSYIISATTIENDLDYFSEIDSSNRAKFCIESNIKNTTKLLLNWKSEIKFEAYFRNYYGLNQKEIAFNIGYKYISGSRFSYSTSVGYKTFGTLGRWNNLPTFDAGFTYFWGI
jgi:hypothetical protein